jgi:transposase-like protein
MLPEVESVQGAAPPVPDSSDACGPLAGCDDTDPGALPLWVPQAVQDYLSHIEGGQSLRAIARRAGCHPSTVLRQVRRFESRRDDPLLDEALARVAQAQSYRNRPSGKDQTAMSGQLRSPPALADAVTLDREAKRVLRRLVETGTVLALAADLDKAAVLRTLPDGQTVRSAVVDRAVAQAFVLKEWIACRKAGRIATYEITAVGRAALKRLLHAEAAAQGLAEAPAAFAGQHRDWDERQVDEAGQSRRLRYNAAESPVAVLARRRDRDGQPFLAPDLVVVAERLREDFELAQMGPRIAQNWERFLTGGDRGGFRPDAGGAEGPRNARERVAAALRDLGPGLGDMVLRVCCFLEGLEQAEQRMGWSARSGKIVLRIALQRLRRHYDETYGRSGPLIG